MLFWLPPISAAVLIVLCWRSGLLPSSGAFRALCAAGLLLQVVAGRFSPLWTLGLVVNAGVAVYLAVRLKLP